MESLMRCNSIVLTNASRALEFVNIAVQHVFTERLSGIGVGAPIVFDCLESIPYRYISRDSSLKPGAKPTWLFQRRIPHQTK